MNGRLAGVVAAALVVILATVAAGLFSYRLTGLGIAFALAAVLAIVCGLYAQFAEQVFASKPKRSMLLMAAMLSMTVIIIAATQLEHSPDWRNFPDTALVSSINDRNRSHPKIIAVDRDHFLLPVTVLAFIHISNDRDIPMTVAEYSLEYASVPVGPWTLLCHVDLETGHLIYFVSDDISKVRAVRLDQRVDQILRGGPVSPHKTISGWSAWYCPAAAADCDQKYIRLSIHKARGETESRMIENIKTEMNLNFLPLARPVSGGQRNLSSSPKRWPQTCASALGD